jgi:hypothetical protein
MARRYQARPKPIILQKGDAGIRIILDSNAFIPLFQRGIFLRRILTPLWKRGEGEIFGRNEAELCGEFLEAEH